MKKRILILTILIIIAVTSAAAQSGGDYAIAQSLIAGGGGQNSAGGTYALDGTIGQAVAGQPATNPPFNLYAGFWTPPAFAPTAAGVTVGGRVTTANGTGIRNVTVTLAGADGGTRTTRTVPSGYFYFTDVPAGATYIISVSAKRYRFAPNSQVRAVLEDISDVNFVAESDFIVPPTSVLADPNRLN